MVNLKKKAEKKQTSHSFDANRKVPKNKVGKGMTLLRDKATINRLLMYRSKVKRNDDGKIVKGYITPSAQQIAPGHMARVAPDRRWFGNTRVIGQKEMTNLRDELKKQVHDPYKVLIKPAKAPLTLIKEPEAKAVVKNQINYTETFGPKALRKKPKLHLADVNEMASYALAREGTLVLLLLILL